MTILHDLYNIVSASTSNTETVIFQQSISGNNVRPAKPYLTIKVLGVNQIGTEENVNLNTITDDKLNTEQIINSNVVLNVQYISDTPDAVFKLDEFKAKMQSKSITDYIRSLDSDIGYMSATNIIDVSAIVLDAFENRASTDITLNLSVTRQEQLDFIETIIYDTITIEGNEIN